MFTIIGADGKEYGPVTADKIREWIIAGRANAQTQARRDGESAWSTIGSLPEFASYFGATPPPLGSTPTAFAASAAAPQRRSVNYKAYAAAIAASGARVDVFECLSRSFSLLTGNFLPLVGVTALVVIVQFVIGMVPILGAIAGILLGGVFYGGLYYYYLGKMRGQPREVGDGFAGFKLAFGPLVLAALIQFALMAALALVFMAPFLGFFVSAIILQHNGAEAALPVLSVPLIALISVGVLFVIYVGVSLCFTYALVIDKGLGPLDATLTSWRVVTSNWFSVFFTLVLGGILAALGVILLFVGVLLTIPIAIGAILYAYEALFNTPEANAALEANTTR